MICRVCGHNKLRLIRQGRSDPSLGVADFKITDGNYGKTFDIFKCLNCGFLQCHTVLEILSFYENLEDSDYEESRDARTKQMLRILRWISKKGVGELAKKSLLDVGAGSGILVEAAINAGLDAVGVEPSIWMCKAAREHGVIIEPGTIEQFTSQNRGFDVISLIDVIEHVNDPAGLLKTCTGLLNDSGHLVIVTPDCDSIAAQLFGWNWWHYRIAHISYFNKLTLEQVLNNAGLKIVAISRPTWWFSLDYLCERLVNYLPKAIIPRWSFLKKISFPLNLFDSILVLARKQ